MVQSILRLILRIFLACFCGLFLIAVLAPYDPWVQHYVAEHFKKAFCRAMDCSLEGDVTSLNIIFPSLTFTNVRVKSVDDNAVWHWECKEYSTGFSWMHLLKMKMIDMWVDIVDMHMYSAAEGKKVHIASHLKHLINPSSVGMPLQCKHFTLRKGSLTLKDMYTDSYVLLTCSAQAKNMQNTIKTCWYIFDGEGNINNHYKWKNVAGSFFCDIQKQKNKTVVSRIEGELSTLFSGADKEQLYFITTSYDGSQGKISVHTDNNTSTCESSIFTQKENDWTIACSGSIALKELLWIATGKVVPLDGQCLLSINGSLHDEKGLKIQAQAHHCHYKQYGSMGEIIVNAVFKNSQLAGTVSAVCTPNTKIVGLWKYDTQNKTGLCAFHNSMPVTCGFIDHWYIKSNDCKVSASYDCRRGISVMYDCFFSHTTIDKMHHVYGSIDYYDGRGAFKGFKDDVDHYNATFYPGEYPYLHFFSYNNDDTALLTAHSDNDGITIDCNVLLIRNIIASWFNREIQAEGTMQVQLSFDREKVAAHCSLNKGIVRLPQTYNFIDGGCVDFVYRWDDKALSVQKIDGSMHCGTFSMKDGTMLFDAQFKPSFIHMPLIFNHCLLNMKRDLFVMASGHLLLEKRDALPLLSGGIIIERGQIKENILSQEFQKQIGLFSTNMFTLSSSTIQTQISFRSRNGIKIDTPFLKTTAKVSLDMSDLVTQPVLSGTISLLGGSLQFPYRPLFINHGLITFNAERRYDPLIDLLAKNQVRNHRVALHISGSLLDHHIALESSPSLTDEQIIGLLLTGSSEESLKNMMPALIINNLKSLIFGSNQFNFLNKYFRPLGNSIAINLIPSFTDQSGRGALRGTLEISVNDRWRAMIQRNFNFTEDMRFELEYLLTDDIILRSVRDEQKNVGFEAEMRWKF